MLDESNILALIEESRKPDFNFKAYIHRFFDEIYAAHQEMTRNLSKMGVGVHHPEVTINTYFRKNFRIYVNKYYEGNFLSLLIRLIPCDSQKLDILLAEFSAWCARWGIAPDKSNALIFSLDDYCYPELASAAWIKDDALFSKLWEMNVNFQKENSLAGDSKSTETSQATIEKRIAGRIFSKAGIDNHLYLQYLLCKNKWINEELVEDIWNSALKANDLEMISLLASSIEIKKVSLKKIFLGQPIISFELVGMLLNLGVALNSGSGEKTTIYYKGTSISYEIINLLLEAARSIDAAVSEKRDVTTATRHLSDELTGHLELVRLQAADIQKKVSLQQQLKTQKAQFNSLIEDRSKTVRKKEQELGEKYKYTYEERQKMRKKFSQEMDELNSAIATESKAIEPAVSDLTPALSQRNVLDQALLTEELIEQVKIMIIDMGTMRATHPVTSAASADFSLLLPKTFKVTKKSASYSNADESDESESMDYDNPDYENDYESSGPSKK